MALGSTGINTTVVGNYIGSASHLWSVLCGFAGLNKYSFYAPGQLSVDANKDIVLTPPTSNFKLGDYRLYDKLAETPMPHTSGNIVNWIAATISFTEAWHPFTLNIKAIAGHDNYVTVKFYNSAADRLNEANPRHTQTFPITYNSITPLVGHTRQSSYQCDMHQNYTITGLSTVLLANDATLFRDTYISDSTGGRVVNLGTKANGYSETSFHKYQVPYITYSAQDITPRPAGYTHVFPRVHSAATPVCTHTNVAQTQGATGIDFYVKALGIYPGSPSNRILDILSCDVVLTYGGISQTLATGVSISYSSATHITGFLSEGRTWAYDTYGTISLNNVVYASELYTGC